MARPRRLVPWGPSLLAVGGLLVLLAAGVPPAHAKEKLVAANTGQMQRTDGRGFNWDPTTEGVIRDGTSDCFDDAVRLKVNGGEFRPTKPAQQTKDGLEFVFHGAVGQIEVTRRLRIQSASGAIRCIEVFENKSKRAVRVQAEIWSMLGSNAGSSMTNTGRVLTNGPLQKGETSVFAIQTPGGRPSVIFQLRGTRSKMTPILSVQNNRTFTVTWSINLPAGRSTAIMHSVAQRRFAAPPAPKQMEAEIKPMLDSKWLRELPTSVRGSISNHNTSGGGAEALTQATPAHQEVLGLAKAYDLERGKEATVYIDREKPLQGSAQGATLEVTTRMGAVSVPFDDVAVIRGGAGVGRSMRLFLRDGEILAGDIRAPELIFKTTSGLDIPLDPGGIDALFLPAAKADGVVTKGTEAFLTQLDGTKLALEQSTDVQLDAVSPWGDLAIPLEDVIRIRYAREPLPGLWILLRDGSRFPLAVRGASWSLESRRFGTVKVAPGSIAAWSRHGVAAAVTKTEDDEVVPAATHAQLVGSCFLAGALADETLTIETIAGTTRLEVDQIRSVTRSDDAEGSVPTFVIQMLSGESLEGRLSRPLLRFRTARGVCRLPVLHLWSYRWAPPLEPAPPKDASSKGDAPKDGASKGAAPKDDAAKDDPPKDDADKAEAPKGAPPKDAPKGHAPKKDNR